MSNAIEVRGLHYRVEGFTLRGIDLTVPTGAVYGFLGPNGSGKSTTIRLLLGLLRQEGGTVRLLGQEVPGDIVHVLRRTGYVPERPHLYQDQRVSEAIQFHAAFHQSFDRDFASALLTRFALPSERHLGRLSKGEMGKLMILLALAQRPDLLILDEPTDGLDPVVRREALSAILEYVSDTRATVLVSSHLVHELERFCDWIGVLDGGTMVAEMPMQEFKSGLKRLRVGSGLAVASPPFALLAREGDGLGGEVWTVRGWRPDMATWFPAGAPLREVIDLDLEDAFVELLRSARVTTEGVN